MESNSDVKKNSTTSTSSPASEDSLSQQIESSETSSTFSATSNPSPKQCSESTGPKQPFTETSGLLPTPTVQNAKHAQASAWEIANRPTHLHVILSFSQAVSPASLFPKLDEEEERKMTATSGLKCYESYESFIRAGSSVKMLAGLLLGTKAWFSNKCILTWKVKVTKSKRLLFQLSPSVRRTGEIESGLLATPNTMDAMAPKTDKAVIREATVTRKGRTNFANLRDQIYRGKLLKTPSASEGVGGTMNLQKAREMGWNPKYKMRDQIGDSTGLKLQPAFVEWMMGFPEGWTEIPDSKLLEMRLSRKLQKK